MVIDGEDLSLFSVDKRRILAREEELVADLQAFSRANGGKPISRSGYKKWKLARYSGDTIVRKFGSWAAGCERAGVPYLKKHSYNDLELLEHFERVWRWRGQKVVQADLIEYNKTFGTTVHHCVYARRWGGFKRFVGLFSQYKLKQITFQQIVDEKQRKPGRAGLSPSLRAKVLRRDNYTCQDCGASPRSDDEVILHVHHTVPVSKGGTNELSNLVTNCSKCNIGKGDKICSK